MCTYYAGVGMQYLDWIHQDHLRPSGDLVEEDGLVDPEKVVGLGEFDS
jgi:hypothetical protein